MLQRLEVVIAPVTLVLVMFSFDEQLRHYCISFESVHVLGLAIWLCACDTRMRTRLRSTLVQGSSIDKYISVRVTDCVYGVHSAQAFLYPFLSYSIPLPLFAIQCLISAAPGAKELTGECAY